MIHKRNLLSGSSEVSEKIYKRCGDTPIVLTARFDIFEHALPLDVKRIVLASATKSCK